LCQEVLELTMQVKTAKYWADILNKLDPNQPVMVTLLDKFDLSDEVDTFSCEAIEVDDKGEPLIKFDVETDFTDELFNQIIHKFNNDDHLWETYNTTLDDCMREVIGDFIKEKCDVVTNDKELWEE